LLGELLALLSVQSKDFAVLPPRLIRDDSEIIEKFERLQEAVFGDVENSTVPFLLERLMHTINLYEQGKTVKYI